MIKQLPDKKHAQKWQAVPLKGSFMVLAILGFFISAYLITSTAWRVTFLIIFVAMFVASLISLSQARDMTD